MCAVPDVLTGILRSTREKPGTTAVVVGDEALTYREFETAAAALAARLAAAGVRPGQTVLLYLRQSVRTLVGMAAALRLGAAWCVLEPGHPPERIAALLRDVDCAALVLDGADVPAAPRTARELAAGAPRPLAVLEADGPAPDPAASAPPPPPEPVHGALPAYTITTSGSTGEPKAIVVSRDNLAHMVANRVDEPGLTTFSPCRFTWDGSLMLLFLALCSGGTAVLPDHRGLPDPEAAAALVVHRRAARIAAPPSYYRLMLEHLAPARGHLSEVILAGEAFPPSLVAQHRAVLPDTRLRNEYGPTETTVTVLGHPVTGRRPGRPGDPDGSGAAADTGGPVDPAGDVPLGRPTGTTHVHVLDERLVPTPPGTVGELYIGGPQVAQGYAARPAGTARCFVADPFAPEPGARMYRTGDLALVDENGDIRFRGRVDGQLKVRGIRVERHAVESALESHPAVRQAAVLGAPDGHGGTRLVAFWTAAEAALALPGTRELMDLCAERLGEHAVPELLVPVGHMPLAASGKADERALLALLPDTGAAPADGPDGPDGTAGPSGHGWTPLEQAVARLWEKVLQHDDFGPEDSFFSVGGNSRRVVELHLSMQREWPGAVRVGRLFDLDTVPAQAEALSTAATTAPEAPAPAAALTEAAAEAAPAAPADPAPAAAATGPDPAGDDGPGQPDHDRRAGRAAEEQP